MREIPKKNYIILTIICLFSIMISLYIASWYKMTNELKNETSIFEEHSLELKIDELNNYLIENPSSIIYITNNSNYKLEKSIYDYLLKENLLDTFVYINIDEYSGEKITKIIQGVSDIKIYNKYPNIYMTENSKITSSVLSNKDNLNLTKTKTFIEKEIKND